MKKTIKLLKNADVLDRLQRHFAKVKPPKGTSNKAINTAIINMVKLELAENDELADDFVEAILDDAAEAIRNQISIEFVDEREFHRNSSEILHNLVDMLFEKGGERR